jgi:hypothetical protein
MKNLILFILFLFGGIVSKAQYKPLLTNSTIWREVNIPTWNIQVASDTVINGFSYKKLMIVRLLEPRRSYSKSRENHQELIG